MYSSQNTNDPIDTDIDKRKVILLTDISDSRRKTTCGTTCQKDTPPVNTTTPPGVKDHFYLIDNNLPEEEIRRGKWERDELSTHCGICSSEFSIFLRKHHCRCCGKIFCYHCTNFYTEIPHQDKKHSPRQIMINDKPPQKEKVCSFCFK